MKLRDLTFISHRFPGVLFRTAIALIFSVIPQLVCAFSINPSIPASAIDWRGINTENHQCQLIFNTDAFQPDALPAPASYLRYAWLPQQSQFTWPDDSVQDTNGSLKWESTEAALTLNVAETGVYYLYVKSYDSQGHGLASGELRIGPFQIDVDPPTPDPSTFIDVQRNRQAVHDITWVSATTVDTVKLSGTPYGWKLDSAAEQFTDSANLPVTDLTSNTFYTMSLRTRDAAGNATRPVTLTTVTFQNSPERLTLNPINPTQMQIIVEGNFPNLTKGQSGLQVKAALGGSIDKLSPITQDTSIEMSGLEPNTRYDFSAQAFNQAGEATGWINSIPGTTAASPPSLSTDTPAYNAPAGQGIYAGGKIVKISDSGDFDSGRVSFYKTVVNELEGEPSSDAFGSVLEEHHSKTWTSTFDVTGVSYVHVRSYNRDGKSAPANYVRLGPWAIDADPPKFVGNPLVTVHGVSSMTFSAGQVADVGPAGLSATPYSFDNGATFVATADDLRENLDTNAFYSAEVVLMDAVGNKSVHSHLAAYTYQNAPTKVSSVTVYEDEVVVKAEGDFPNLDKIDSGIQFGVQGTGPIIWTSATWPKVTEWTFSMLDPNTPLDPNTVYKFYAKARNAQGFETAVTGPLTVMTLAIPPRARAMRIPQTWYADGEFRFRALDLPGPKTYHHYVYAWNKIADYDLNTSAEDGQWRPLTKTQADDLVVHATDSGKWYLHLQSVNENGDKTDPDELDLPFGWFGLDQTPPAPARQAAPIPDVKQIIWNADPLSTDTLSGLNNSPYIWSFDNGPEGFTTPASSVTFNLTPNTSHRMELRLRDVLGNVTADNDPESILTIVTLAAPPSPYPISSQGFTVYKTSVDIQWINSNPPGTEHVVELSMDPSFPTGNIITITALSAAPGPMKVTAGATPNLPLQENTTYYVRARAVNSANVPTTPDTSLGVFTTRPRTPDVVVNPPANNSYPRGTIFKGTSQANFGPGGVEYYRWVWDTNQTRPSWSSREEKVDSQNPQISTQVFSSGQYYLHIAAYSGGTFVGQPESVDFGPFNVIAANATDPVLQVVSVSSDSIVWKQEKASGPNFSDAGAHYGFQLNEGTTEWISLNNGLVAQFSKSGLTPNTTYTMSAYLKDDFPLPDTNFSGPIRITVRTNQAKPSTVLVSNIQESSMTLQAIGPFSNIDSSEVPFKFSLTQGALSTESGWRSSDIWKISETTLLPNTLCTISARVRNRDGAVTDDSSPVFATTLAETPNQNRIKAIDPRFQTAGNYFALGETFVFQTQASLTQGDKKGTVEYYQVLVDQNGNVQNLADFDGATATRWDSSSVNFSTKPAYTGNYYFHFRSYNSANPAMGGDPYTFGPLIIDTEPPSLPRLHHVEVFVSSVTWVATDVTDNIRLPANPYNFTFPSSDGIGSSTYTARNLVPNSLNSINLVVTDAVGNKTAPLSVSTYTEAAVPTPVDTSLKIFNSSATIGHWELNENSALTRYEVGASLTPEMDDPIFDDVGVNVTSGSVTGLQVDTDYWFGVRAVNFFGHKTPWAVLGVHQRTPDSVIAPVIQLPIATTPNQITLQWTDGNVTGTTYETLINAGATLDTARLPSSAGSNKMNPFNTLTPNTTYSLGVRARTPNNKVSEYRTALVVTLAESPVKGTSFEIYASSAFTNWLGGNNPNDTQYEMRVSSASTFDGADDLKTLVNGPSGFIIGLTPDTSYYFGVRALNRAGVPTAPWVALGEGHTGVQAPYAPVYSEIKDDSLNVSWSTGTNPSQVRYQIDRSKDNLATDPQSSVITADNNIQATGLDFNTTYYFQGKTMGVLSTSTFVNFGPVVTLATTPVISEVASGLDFVAATWTKNGNPDWTDYEVQVSSSRQFLDLRTGKVRDTQFKMPDLTRNTTYWIRVYGINSAGVRTQEASASTYTVTLATTPTQPTLSAKWSSALGNYIQVSVNPADVTYNINPIDTLYSIQDVTDPANLKYLTGNGDGSMSATPVWWTRDEWSRGVDGTTVGTPRGTEGNLLPRTLYRIRVIAKNHTGIQTDPSVQTEILSVPAQPTLTAHVEDNDRVVLNWVPMDANEFRVYVSPTNDPNAFVRYYHFVPSFSTMSYIDSDLPDKKDIPNNTNDTRHNTEGGTPGIAAWTSDPIQVTTGTIQFSWRPVANPSAAPLNYYRVVGLNGFKEEGQPSNIVSAQVFPVIQSYVVGGTKLDDVLISTSYALPAGPNGTVRNLRSNTQLLVKLQAQSSDGRLGPESSLIETWTLANPPEQATVTPGVYDESHRVSLDVDFSTAGNSFQTQYAIKWVAKNGQPLPAVEWIRQGGTDPNHEPYWQTKKEWDKKFTHTNLETSSTYTYEVYARNGNESGGPHLVTTPSSPSTGLTITTPPPSLTSGVGTSVNKIRWSWQDNTSDETGFQILGNAGGTDIRVPNVPPSIPRDSKGIISYEEQLSAAPNTLVKAYFRSGNSSGFSVLSAETTAYTLAVPPQIISVNHEAGPGGENNNLTFEFRNDVNKIPAFGPGTLAYYRVEFSSKPTHDFSGTEPKWENPTQEMTFRLFKENIIDSHSDWYLHVMSYNNQDTPSTQTRFGPYRLFQDVDRPKVTAFTHEGAEVINGKRELSELGRALDLSGQVGNEREIAGFPEKPSLDISFAAGIPWAPGTGAIRAYFSKPMDGHSISNQTVLVTAIEDNMGRSVPAAAALSYLAAPKDGNGIEITFPYPGLEKGFLYEVRITKGVTDTAQNPIAGQGDFLYYFRTYLDPAKAAAFTIRDPDGSFAMRVSIAAGALPDSVYSVGVETDPVSAPFGFNTGGKNTADNRQMELGGEQSVPLAQRFAGWFGQNPQQPQLQLKGPATISIPYYDVNPADGYVDDRSQTGSPSSQAGRQNDLAPANARIKVSTLGLYRYDETTKLWVKVPGAVVDTNNHLVTAQVYQLGLYALAGAPSTEVGSAFAYPVPFVSSKNSAITFTSLPDVGEIKIYSVTGELVKQINVDTTSGNKFVWDVKNDSGQSVAPDVYFYIIKSGGNQKKGKLVIVR